METKSLPIIFTANSVRDILAGRKTMTRRIVKPQPDHIHEGQPYWNIGGFRLWSTANNPLKRPFVVGRQLWVKEKWCPKPASHGDCYGYAADMMYACGRPMPADYEKVVTRPWRSPLFMPRIASRITLEVTAARCEWLQEISEEDASAEGCQTIPCKRCDERGEERGEACEDCAGRGWHSCSSMFQGLWQSINGKKHPWQSNPLVWAISFRRLDLREA